MTPVMLLTDGYIANAAEPWKVPDMASYAPFPVQFLDEVPAEGGFLPYARDDKLRAAVGQARHAGPDPPHRRHREGSSTPATSTTRPPTTRR